jgi:hypothetical protein
MRAVCPGILGPDEFAGCYFSSGDDCIVRTAKNAGGPGAEGMARSEIPTTVSRALLQMLAASAESNVDYSLNIVAKIVSYQSRVKAILQHK